MENGIVRLQAPEQVPQLQHVLGQLSAGQYVICFDYFDTLVTRCVLPEHTKVMASSLLSKLLGGTITGEKIYQHRKDIEFYLTETSMSESGESEFQFQDLSGRLWATLCKMGIEKLYDNPGDFYHDMLSIEVAVEKKVQEICLEVLVVVKNLSEANFKICLVSDFYLPEKQFRDILKFHNIEHLFTAVYVSAERGVSKGSGRVYPVICSEQKISPDQLVMIGDNEHADVKMASKYGTKAIHLKPVYPKRITNCLSPGYCKSDVDLFDSIHIPDEQPFSEMGVSLWFFTHRLFQKLYNGKVRNVFFLSKEGEFLKKIFDLYQLELFGRVVIASHYLLASRKSTFIASLRQIESEDFSRLLDHYRDISIKDFLQSLNFTPEDVDALITASKVDYDSRLTEIKNHRYFKILVESSRFKKTYEKRREEQHNHFMNYLDSFGVEYQKEGLHLVDVGWKGSIQDNIFHILNKRTVVNGYFVGLLNPTEQHINNKKTGLLFDIPNLSPFCSVYNNNRSLFEMLLGASHGSADYYRNEVSRFDHSTESNNDNSLQVDNPYVVTVDLPEERELFKKMIEPLQNRMLELNSRLNTAFMISRNVPPQQWFAEHHAKMVYKPDDHEVSFFESLFHLENFGIFEFTDFSSPDSLSFGTRVKNLLKVLRDPNLLETGIWPPVILNRMGIGWFRYFDGRRRYRNEF